ncbi:PilZ domain-containing protein [Mangrovitalea sediminis]|uniref:PilZ domain-containing protein n=1 Tax=Mangrovitalea sediminis TaxID=1982043 RepID=UPI000BE52235|nr:PilZ domain-containing protein [Mangrovitalea sediminis]
MPRHKNLSSNQRAPKTAPSAPDDSVENVPSNNRRQFYRIEDRIGLEVRVLANADQSLDAVFNDAHLGPLYQEVRRLDQDIRLQMSLLAEKERQISSLFKSLNLKLDTLARIMAFQQNPLQPSQWCDVTLSEGGLAFSAALLEEDLQPGDGIALRLTLMPDLARPRMKARVLDLVQAPGETSRVHVEFVEMDDHDRQSIARHVLRWQARQRQSQQPDPAS